MMAYINFGWCYFFLVLQIFCDIFSILKQTIVVLNIKLGGVLMAYPNKPKPDDRSDNVEKLQSMIQNTIENMDEAEESLAFTDSAEQREQIEAKNERRRESLNSMRSEIKDEAQTSIKQ